MKQKEKTKFQMIVQLSQTFYYVQKSLTREFFDLNDYFVQLFFNFIGKVVSLSQCLQYLLPLIVFVSFCIDLNNGSQADCKSLVNILYITTQLYQRMSKLFNSNKENMPQQPCNGTKRAIKLKNSQRRCFGEELSNEATATNDGHCEEKTEREGQQKLIQLTAQCAQYFERFTSEKDAHLQVIDRAFSQISQKVDLAFGRIILQAQRKLNEIRTFLTLEHQRLKEEKRGQQQQLSRLLVEIKSVHLTRLDSNESLDMKQVLAEYAGSLDKFFNIMTEIQSSSYEDNVEQCMNFINNLVKQELRTIVEDKFPPKVEDIIGHHFNNDDCFTFQENGIRVNEETLSLIDQMQKPPQTNTSFNFLDEIKCIKNRQTLREDHITQYRSLMVVSNPFKAIKLST